MVSSRVIACGHKSPVTNFLRKKKAPRDALGLVGNASSREKRLPLRHGRVVWLTAQSADDSGGTAADSHGLPHFPCLQIGNSVYAASKRVSMRGTSDSAARRVSGSSRPACAFRRERG